MDDDQRPASPLPAGFAFLDTVDPTIEVSLRYATKENFTGRPVVGYTQGANRAVMTLVCAQRLAAVQTTLRSGWGVCLVVYDAYRPRRAVDDFVAWSQQELQRENKWELSTALMYYPGFCDDRRRLFDEQYISKRSNHARGSTVDVTLIKIGDQLQPPRRLWRNWDLLCAGVGGDEASVPVAEFSPAEAEAMYMNMKATAAVGDRLKMVPFIDDGTIDMGSSFDLFHRLSHPPHGNDDLLLHQQPAEGGRPQCEFIKWRKVLAEAMITEGFVQSDVEWWHFWLEQDEPFRPDATRPEWGFDFEIPV